MLLRLVVFAIGLVELTWPRQFVDFWMDLAAKDGDAVELRPWVYSAARAEGFVFVVWALSRRRRDGS